MLQAVVNGFARVPLSACVGLSNTSLLELSHFGSVATRAACVGLSNTSLLEQSYFRSFASKATGAPKAKTAAKGTKKVVKTVKKAAAKPKKPQKPKRVPSAFNLYVKDQYQNYRKGDAKAPQIMKQLAVAWKKLSEMDKRPFQQQAEKLKTQKEKLMEQKKASKGPLSAYPQFIRDNYSQVSSQNPGLKSKEVIVRLAGMWKTLPPLEKNARMSAAESAKKQFKQKKASA